MNTMPTDDSSSKQDPFQILMVDDDVDQLEISRISLEDIDSNLKVTSVTTPEGALKLLEEDHFDCVVSDYKMPGMNGIMLTRKIRETSDIPVIIYTGQGSEEVASTAFEAGVDDYIRKERGLGHFKVLTRRIESAVQKRLFELDRTRYEERLETIYRHASELGRTTSLKEIAGATLDGIEKTFGFEKMSFSIRLDNVLKPVEVRGDTPIVRTEIPLDAPGIIAKAVRTGNTINLPDVRDDPDYFMARSTTRSELVVPVKIGGETLAVLNIESTEVNAFANEDQKLIEIFAEHIASNMIRSRTDTTMEMVMAMVVHDLRGPLVTIVNAVQLIRSSPGSSERMLTMIEDNADRSIAMLEDLRERLLLTPLMKEEMSLSALISMAVEDAFIPDSVKVDLQLDDDLGSLMIDASKMRRVLDNLIRNGLDAMPSGGELTISALRDSVGVRLEISDSGVGISKGDMMYLFVPFHSKKVGGLGVGLVYCKQTVEAHGGTISVESELGKGTTIRISIPLTG